MASGDDSASCSDDIERGRAAYQDVPLMAQWLRENVLPPYIHVRIPPSTASGAEGDCPALALEARELDAALGADYPRELLDMFGLVVFRASSTRAFVGLSSHYDDVHSYNVRASELLGQCLSGPVVLLATGEPGREPRDVARELLAPVSHLRNVGKFSAFVSGLRTTMTGALGSLSINRFFAAPHELDRP